LRLGVKVHQVSKRTALSLGGAAALLVLGVYASWVALYPEEYDPKNIHYLLWKHGLSQNIDLDSAVGGMTHDKWAVNIVKGMSRGQLDRRFGYVRTLDQVTPYLRECHALSDTAGELGVPAHGKDAVFLRDSWLMVILDDGKAVDLVLCKGY
jgi:hypothetical protein